ncbi:Pre-mRNA-processing factor 40-like protein A [Frankliniella fusca]|uniref:Pre-mRNA-processing factor 40-like protein A n=1 Tax=Frankliniella fusca TaxID=407009 RepID=A0AAE1HS86_9NEOP|nr:Pre-mRNA-processing factor 40-like protein A [Frankliniella fusca]
MAEGGGPPGAFTAGMPHLAPGYIPSPGMANPPGLPPQMFSMPPPGFGVPGYVAPDGKPITSNGDPVVQMNGDDNSNPAVPLKKSDWTEHTAPDGRVYYYNSVTKCSLWEKPDELKTPTELLLSRCPWKEYISENGKTYYHNVETKESRWVIPEELQELKARIAADEVKSITVPPLAGVGGPAMPAMPLGTAPIPIPPALASGVSLSPVMGHHGTPPHNSKNSSALDQAMAATLATLGGDAPANKGSAPASRNGTPEPKLVFKDKKEAIEAVKDLLRDHDVPSNASWEAAVKLIQHDSRYAVIKNLNERKQAFNAYKTQKLKEEKEGQRLKAKKAKEDLEEYLMNNPRMTSLTKYYRCEEMYGVLDVWKNVSEHDRRDIYDDVIFNLAKKEKEEAKALKKRNMKSLAEILDSMTNISYRSTWQEAQQMLIENPAFADDAELLGKIMSHSMDKEDALIVFEDHIRELQKEEEEEKERDKRRLKRQHRKNRDAFITLLDELHEQGKLTSMSLWVELYPIISADLRFSAMLGQGGSSPLDLFKFYVEDLKSRFHDEKKIIKEILKEKNFDVQVTTSFETFATVVCDDRRSATLDAGNVKLTYNALLEKAEAREQQRQKEEARKFRKLEAAFKQLIRSSEISYDTPWDEARLKLEGDKAFEAITLESERVRIYKEFQHENEEACGHHHIRPKKSKKAKSKKKKSNSRSRSRSELVFGHFSEEEDEHGKRKKRKRRSRSRSESHSSSDSERHLTKKSRRKKAKKRRGRSRSHSLQRSGSDDLEGNRGKAVPVDGELNSDTSGFPPEVDISKDNPDSPAKDESKEEGEHTDRASEEKELTEEELQNQRMLLLKQLEQQED